MDSSWYFTSEWEISPVRRGDALGFRGGADYFADLLAPGLSNNTVDARWITLLSWCLKWSHLAWQNAGGKDLYRLHDQRVRYAWLRPLELLWVARTLKSGQDTGQLPGRRSIERWFKSKQQASNFSMSSDQFRRYRQVGAYGAYRVIFRSVSGLTEQSDGWTPSRIAHQLADFVNENLPTESRLTAEHFDQRMHWARWSGGKEARYWLERGWPSSCETTSAGIRPTAKAAIPNKLPEKERGLLESTLFERNSIRRLTAEVLSTVTARSHVDLCKALANSSALGKKLAPHSLAALPSFTLFADAAMEAMRALWDEMNHDLAAQAPPIDRLARSAELALALDQLRYESDRWLSNSPGGLFPHEYVVASFAQALRMAKTPVAQLRVLARHHQAHGGGRHWFREQDGRLVPLLSHTRIPASNYRFRLESLSRLAAQCGVANMSRALAAMGQDSFVDEDGETL